MANWISYNLFLPWRSRVDPYWQYLKKKQAFVLRYLMRRHLQVVLFFRWVLVTPKPNLISIFCTIVSLWLINFYYLISSAHFSRYVSTFIKLFYFLLSVVYSDRLYEDEKLNKYSFYKNIFNIMCCYINIQKMYLLFTDPTKVSIQN